MSPNQRPAVYVKYPQGGLPPLQSYMTESFQLQPLVSEMRLYAPGLWDEDLSAM
jgi:hypothetical protein